MSDIYVDEDFNCRGKITPIDVVELAKDIQRQGLLQPVVLSKYSLDDQIKFGKTWKLLAGFRRYTAHKVMERKEIWATCKTIQMDDVEARFMNLAENLQRVNLNISQEAKALQAFYLAGISEPKVAARLGVSRGWVQQRYLLLKLPTDVQEEFASTKLKASEVRPIYQLYNSGNIEAMYKYIKNVKKARENGKSGDKVSVPVTVSHQKKIAKPSDMFKMMNHMSQSIGFGLHTKVLAWSAGEITLEELFSAIKDHDLNTSIEPKYTIPTLEQYNESSSQA